MGFGYQTPILRIRSDSICLDNKAVRFGQYFRSPRITISSRPASGSGCVAKEAKFEGFTEKAIEATMLAREESRQLGHDRIWGDHLIDIMLKMRELRCPMIAEPGSLQRDSVRFGGSAERHLPRRKTNWERLSAGLRFMNVNRQLPQTRVDASVI
ncbi:hypothetical protein F3Y22_tig00111634pilonHSYRG00055 [Hibiscus syriacus]|uniref:Uncharacterized protein n=1 Tax=Hibiscus syriacus TaxID=106335 RepID=A0A6A2Y512_HIBSY|nr:hypothetical protein F3Y22_tig00111634pilonHSYRG00055 [Hibiscus syriacus]